ncbi:hypothetical protein MMC24_003500 [Lignoscripta atroalba]|nr:hypothetical protein [Lignoscripta atroalba]
MAKPKSNSNGHSNSSQTRHTTVIEARPNILASCYSVDADTSALTGFHYSTTGAGGTGIPEVSSGIPSPPLSPPLAASLLRDESCSTESSKKLRKGGAAYTITGECERLFCKILRATFLGERKAVKQDLLVLDAPKSIHANNTVGHSVINWLEVWDYTGGIQFRGFITRNGSENGLFVFLSQEAVGRDLKPGLMALIELASCPGFDCTRLTICLDRLIEHTNLEGLTRGLGWVGFELTTLAPWAQGRSLISSEWLLLGPEQFFTSSLALGPSIQTLIRRTTSTMSFLARASPPSIFPTYLLPSIPFRRRRTSSTDSAHSSTSNGSVQSPDAVTSISSNNYLGGHTSYLRCARCATDLCLTSQIISKGFTGRHGRAYLVSASPVGSGISATSTARNSPALPNTHTHKAVPRQLVTGAHTVSDVSCAFCGVVIGWKYVAAEEETQRYKVGKFILETKRICSSSYWDNEGTVEEEAERVMEAPPVSWNSGVNDNGVEFDSQDEEECEDLFAGVWSPALAMKRRQGRRFGREMVERFS